MSINIAEEQNNVINLTVHEGGKSNKKPKKKAELRKDGCKKETHSNRKPLQSTEVYALKTKEEIDAMIQIFNNKIEYAFAFGSTRDINAAYRNRLLFKVGINVGLRVGDLVQLTWKDFIAEVKPNREIVYNEKYYVFPQKTESKKKKVTIFINQAVKDAIAEYLLPSDIDITKLDLNTYIFKNNRGSYISPASVWNMMNETAKAAGITQNIGSHSLRKTWGYWMWHNAEDKNKALVTISHCFNHSSTHTTMKYIGLLDEEIEEMYNSVNIGNW